MKKIMFVALTLVTVSAFSQEHMVRLPDPMRGFYSDDSDNQWILNWTWLQDVKGSHNFRNWTWYTGIKTGTDYQLQCSDATITISVLDTKTLKVIIQSKLDEGDVEVLMLKQTSGF